MNEEAVSQITFDYDVNDFKFKVAFEKYSYSFNNLNSEEEKSRLNKCISQLFNNEINYPQFYNEINQYTEGPKKNYAFRRTLIKGEKKRAYRHKAQKAERLKRHK